MSGLCGWASREPSGVPIAQMAVPLCRLNQAPLRTGAHSLGAAALAGGLDAGSLYHEDGLLIAHWGERVDALARLWRAHGAKACAALSGQFAFALVDERRGEALLAVDRCATRPLFYQLVGHTLVFASSADALVLHPGASREVDPQAVHDYLYFQAVPGAIYRGQRRLAPGEYVHFHASGRIERTRYWRLRFQERHPAILPELKAELVDTAKCAVESCIGQQRTGVMLDGDASSAALAALLGAGGNEPVATFAAGCGVRGGLDPARAAARALGSEHHERLVGASDAADVVVQLAAAFDQPCGDPAAVVAYHCALLAREQGAQRLLSGLGAAELFGRRSYYARQLRYARYEALPSELRQVLLEPLLFKLAGGVRRGPLARARQYVSQSMTPLPQRLHADALLPQYDARELFDHRFLALIDPSAAPATVEQSWWLAQARHPLNRMIALDLRFRLADRAVPTLSRALDMAGIAVAFPYLSDAMLAFAARLDPQCKSGAPAGWFADALRALLPRRLARARSPGTAPVIGSWLLADARLKSLAFDSLASLRRRGIVRGAFLDQLLSRSLAEDPGRHGRMIWMLMMLEQWFAQRQRVSPVLAEDGCEHASETG